MQPSQRPSASDAPSGANPGYALGQLASALRTSESHNNPEVRARAERKVKSWTQVFRGMLSGVLQIGSRLPVAGTPAWATLEVVKGGFATGNLLAGGELQGHERDLLARLGGVPKGTERGALNVYYLSEDGLAELQRMVSDGCYRVHVPEEGALLVVAWLVQHGHADRARALLDELAPWLSRLRFYPVPESCPMSAQTVVHRQDVGTTISELQAIKPSLHVEQQKETIEVWVPLYGRVVELFLATVPGALPTLRVGPDGAPLRTPTGQFVIDGDWPCQHYPEGWKEKARAVLDEYRRLRTTHRLCASPESRKSGFATLRRYLEQCAQAPQRLTGLDVSRIRVILASVAHKRGLPGSARWQDMRERQMRQAAAPTRDVLAAVLRKRLSGLPAYQGVASLDDVLAPIRAEEAAPFRVPVGHAIPEALAARVRRCLDAPVGVLVEQGIIPSGEELARVVPQITSQVGAAGIADADLRRLYGAVYAAFRRRRSLLLLNLQSQVKLSELPWVAAMDAFRSESGGTRQQAREVLEEVVSLALTAWPQQILPNKLLQEVGALADGGGLRVPIVDEVAADIFMGAFSEKFLRAAQSAAEMLEGTLYERYYALPYARVRQMSDVKRRWRWGAATSAAFTALCTELAGETGSGWSVARNGKIIEQEQILTTHNLAVLFDALGLAERLATPLDELALSCFAWVCKQLQKKSGSWKTRLRRVKNAAYAWRQMVFFLALGPAGRVESFLARAEGRLREQRPEIQARLRPALEGLARAVRGLAVEAPATADQPGGARRLLGWTTERHWLLA
jgi:hypothetical protein